MVLQLGEQLAEFGLVLWEGLVEQLVPVRVERARVVTGLPDVQSDDDRELVSMMLFFLGASLLVAVLTPDAGTHVTKRPHQLVGRVPISGGRVSLDRAATPPGPLMAGQKSHTRLSDQTPSIGVLAR